MPETGSGPFAFALRDAHDHGKMTMVICGDSMKTIPAGKFKAQCLALIDDVHDHGEEVVITKRGKAMARLVPIEEKKPERKFGWAKGQLTIVGDILEPMMSDEDVAQWERDWDELNK